MLQLKINNANIKFKPNYKKFRGQSSIILGTPLYWVNLGNVPPEPLRISPVLSMGCNITVLSLHNIHRMHTLKLIQKQLY